MKAAPYPIKNWLSRIPYLSAKPSKSKHAYGVSFAIGSVVFL
jgi:hypothetical protein